MKKMKFWMLVIAVFSAFMAFAGVGYAAEKDKDVNEFISVGDMAQGFSENMVPQNTDLVGKEFKLYFEDGTVINHKVFDKDTLSWEIIEGQGKGEKNSCSYYAVSPKDGIYELSFVNAYGNTKVVNMIINTNTGATLVQEGYLPSEKDASIPLWKRAQGKLPMTSVKVEYTNASYEKPFTKNSPKIERTTDLIGHRVQFTYSSKDAYEHIYLNDHTYVWNCISGNEKGNADTETCQYFKVDDNLYLFTWQEKAVPTIGFVVENFDVKRSFGAIYGYDGFDFGKVINIPVGSYLKELNTTKYDYSLLKG
jgi:hypothetical protein